MTAQTPEQLSAPITDSRTIHIPADSRTFIVGTTGSGKSFLSWALLSTASRLIMFDVNGTLFDQTGEWNVTPYHKDYKKLLPQGREKKLIPARLRVPPLNSEDEYNAIFEFILRNMTHVLLYFDEVTGIGKDKGSVALRRLWQQGRAKHIGIFAATQRPADVPSVLLSETAYKIMFELRLEQDLERMEKLIGPFAQRADGSMMLISDLDYQKHDFIVSDPTNRYPQYWQRAEVR